MIKKKRVKSEDHLPDLFTKALGDLGLSIFVTSMEHMMYMLQPKGSVRTYGTCSSHNCIDYNNKIIVKLWDFPRHLYQYKYGEELIYRVKHSVFLCYTFCLSSTFCLPILFTCSNIIFFWRCRLTILVHLWGSSTVFLYLLMKFLPGWCLPHLTRLFTWQPAHHAARSTSTALLGNHWITGWNRGR